MKHWIKILIAAVLSFSLAAVFFVNSFKLTTNSAMVPRILIGLIVFLGILAVAEGYYHEKKPSVTPARIDQPQQTELNELEALQKEVSPINIKRSIIFVLLVALYIFLLDKLGYFIVTPLFIITAYLYLKSLSWWKASAIAVLFTLFVYGVFVVFLKIPIPMGFLR